MVKLSIHGKLYVEWIRNLPDTTVYFKTHHFLWIKSSSLNYCDCNWIKWLYRVESIEYSLNCMHRRKLAINADYGNLHKFAMKTFWPNLSWKSKVQLRGTIDVNECNKLITTETNKIIKIQLKRFRLKISFMKCTRFVFHLWRSNSISAFGSLFCSFSVFIHFNENVFYFMHQPKKKKTWKCFKEHLKYGKKNVA